MKAWIAVGLTLVSLAGAASAQTPIFLSCSIAKESFNERLEPTGFARENRLFKLAPDTFEEWKADEKRFGINHCATFNCIRTQDKLEGTIESASVTFTVGIDQSTRVGYWRSQGATGFSEPSGVCYETADPSLKSAG